MLMSIKEEEKDAEQDGSMEIKTSGKAMREGVYDDIRKQMREHSSSE